MIKYCPVFFICLFSFQFLLGQTPEQLKKIEEDYNYFKDHQLLAVEDTVDSSQTKTQAFQANFPRTLLDKVQLNYSIGISDPFLDPAEAIPQAIKRASFLQALRTTTKAFAVIDVYTKYSAATRKNEDVEVKEMVNVFVDSLYSIKGAEIIKHEYLATGELILTIDFSKCEKKATTAIFEVYQDTKEKGKALQKISKIKLTNQDEEYVYKKMYHGNEIETNGISTNVDYDNYFFTYSSYKTKFGIKGGLWAYIIMQLSNDIAEQASSKTTYTKSIKDQYNQELMIHLTRNVGFYKYDFGYNAFIYSLRKF